MAQNGVGSDRGDNSNGQQQPTVAALPPPSGGGGGVGSAPNSGNMPLNLNNKAAIQQQLQKMKDANSKYKNLLKMAKERIEQQEQELRTLRDENEKNSQEQAAAAASSALHIDGDGGDGNITSGLSIVRICQRIKVELDPDELNAKGGNEEIWVLVEYEEVLEEENFGDAALGFDTTKKIKRWKKFDTENELSDFIRRDTGEPLSLPSYSLTPQQSSQITADADKQVNAITEEYRRFRVKSEMTRKQMDTQIRELQSTHVESARRRIEGQEVEKELEAARTEHSQLERLRGEMSRQEAQWKEAYDVLLRENEALKSSGSEAMLASQWRQRYETCLKEKEEAENQCRMAEQRAAAAADGDQYEMKYRDLKESFRMYRKKAKEIFEAQQQNSGGGGRGISLGDGGSNHSAVPPISPNAMMMKISSNSNEESKLSYLKNLMVNYLTAEPEVKEHMEAAIGTVLQFTPEELKKIKEKKEYDASWGLF